MREKLLLSVVLALVTLVTGILTWKIAYQSALDGLEIDANQNVVEYLERVRDLSSAYEIRLLNSSGNQLFSTSNINRSESELDTLFFSKAMQGALGVEIRRDKTIQIRTLTFARSVLNAGFKQLGAVVLEMEVEILESEFRARPEILMFLDGSGTVVFSNRTQLIFKQLVPYQSVLEPRQAPYISPFENIKEQPINESFHGSVAVWDNFSAVPSHYSKLVARQTILPINLDAILLVDTRAASLQARKITSLSVALLILAIVSGIAIFQRRRRFIERIEAEQELIKELDRRVELRSTELERAQNELVQSAKLSALGKMSVGISHELSQPIASIQTFAVNAKRLLEANQVDQSQQNLIDIEVQTERMSRIIRNLRNFSRKDALPRELVDICKIVNQVSNMLKPRLKDEGVELTIDSNEQSILVMGGEIRLQQVLINLISNAIEAIENQTTKLIHVNIEHTDNIVEISIRDNGPGLSDPSRVFEPFYTTKNASHDDGLGLGLSIAYGFVESFGGTLRATNCDDGGALFTLNLATVQLDKAGNQP